jgi:exopolyphosphatase/guanosine-5'-triphosphate,3'-diphosphate pyrophosphatase
MGANISGHKIDMASGFFRNVLSMSKANKAEKIIAFATQAARRAPNFYDLQSKISDRFGVDLQILSGIEEAALMANCVRQIMNLSKFVSFDIGCGSLEVVEFNGSIKGIWSLPLSSIDLSAMGSFAAAEIAVEQNLQMLKFNDSNISGYPLVGSGGTLRVANLLINGSRDQKFTRQEVESLLNVLMSKTEEEREALGVPRMRADIFPFGLLVVRKLMAHVHNEELDLMMGNLRLSLALNYFKMFPWPESQG